MLLLPLQVEEMGFGYKWDEEEEAYGPLGLPFDRLSNDGDSELEERDEELKMRCRGKGRSTLKAVVGPKWLKQQRNMAKYEALKNPRWTVQKFNQWYPEFNFSFADSDDYPEDIRDGVSM